MEEIYKRANRSLVAEAKKDFVKRAEASGFDVEQALFLWNFLLNSETMKKMMNLVAHLQKERDFRI